MTAAQTLRIGDRVWWKKAPEYRGRVTEVKGTKRKHYMVRWDGYEHDSGEYGITDVQISDDGHIKIGWKDPNYAAALFTLEEMETAVRLVYEQLQVPGPAPGSVPGVDPCRGGGCAGVVA